ncbi:response regulator, partial [Enterobacter genomosp. O]|uniref:response regulator n=1 Tax=Enterobacter genomosp. O TaxID=2364150 RepID=UPI001F60FCC0
MNKIVYVEDEPEVGQLIAAYLGKHDMDVIVEPRGDRAEEVVVRENPDLVLLDIMLPGKDGMTLCRDLRARWDGPIVLLTSLDSDMNHILSLEMGANDYILKTTPPAVLLARLRLHLRQHASVEREAPAPSLTPHKAMRFGTLSIDPINRQVLLSGELIPRRFFSSASRSMICPACVASSHSRSKSAVESGISSPESRTWRLIGSIDSVPKRIAL